MIFIAYTRFSEALPDDSMQRYLLRMPVPVREKIGRFRRWQDAQASLFGKLLLLEAAKEIKLPGLALSELKYNDFDRPFIDRHFDFNISHTEGLVGCAVCDRGAVGLDVERIRAIDLNDFRNVYTGREIHFIEQAADPGQRFFYCWTRKEALIKADGRGMSLTLTDIEVLEDQIGVSGKTYYLHQLGLDDRYQVHLATDQRAARIVTREYDFT